MATQSGGLQALLLLLLVPGLLLFRLDYENLAHIKVKTPASEQAQAVHELIARLLPDRAEEFRVEVNSSLGPENQDTFEFETQDGKLVVRGTTGVAAAWGFQHFLKYVCKAHVSWSGDQLNIPKPLPKVSPKQRVVTPYRFRYYQNVCTSSYSFAWWNWTRWEREIDWMAMNGINLPLAFTAQETIWRKVYLKLGLNQEDLDKHFGGPAFLAWARMGNIRGWGGPLPASWYTYQMDLQHRILSRMHNLGMFPVLPGFAGHIPEGLTRLYPNISVTRLRDWGHFKDPYCCTYFLDPRDKMFSIIGNAFIQAQEEEYGLVSHIYNCDPFNEMLPSESDPAYLSSVSQAIYSGMLQADPQAVWMVQGWMFRNQAFWKPPQVKAFLHGVPLGRMIVLDLFAEVNPLWQSTESFYGQPFIWCMLHNFGGNLGMYGAVESVSKGPLIARSWPNSSMIGTGLTPEGIEQNDVIYELMNEMGMRTENFDIQQWMTEYSTRRYGAYTEKTALAWHLLARSVYNCTKKLEDHCHAIPVTRPSLFLDPPIWYNTDDIQNAMDLMMTASLFFSDVETFRYDLVDLTRQFLQIYSRGIYRELVDAYNNKSLQGVQLAGSNLKAALTSMDEILGANKFFLLGNWLESAKSLASDEKERALYEFNARNQVTLWGPDGEIHDYANKMWNGLVSGFYLRRWTMFISALSDALQQGRKFNQTAFDEEVLKFEKTWNHKQELFSVHERGDPVTMAKYVLKKFVLNPKYISRGSIRL